MASTSRKSNRFRKRASRTAVSEGKVRKRFWLDRVTLAEARSILGTATEHETVEVALELVTCRRHPRRVARR